jgi:hypothetical protein
MAISRKYDFQPGTKISSQQIDDEFNQLVATSNDLETDIGIRYTKGETDVKFAKKQQDAYIPAVFQNAWINYGNNYSEAGYMLDEFGFVHLRGMIYNGILAKAAFLLPEGMRPAKILRFSTQAHNGTTQVVAAIDIKPAGNVDVVYGGSTWVLLDGIPPFKAEL